MITAWPTTSPINVSATSTPLYYMTAYPSYNPNNSSDLLGSVLSIAPSGTATILGAVAVGVVGVGGLAYAANYLRKGGTVSGLIAKAKSEQGAFNNLVQELPIDSKLKQELQNPEAVLQSKLQSTVQKEVDKLPISSAQKAQIQSLVPTNIEQLQQDIQNPEQLKQQAVSIAMNQLAAQNPALSGLINSAIEQKPVLGNIINSAVGQNPALSGIINSVVGQNPALGGIINSAISQINNLIKVNKIFVHIYKK